MPDAEPQTCIAFEGHRRIASGPLDEVRPVVQAAMARGAERLLQELKAKGKRS